MDSIDKLNIRVDMPKRKHYLKYEGKTDTIKSISKTGSKPAGSGWKRVYVEECQGPCLDITIAQKSLSFTAAHVTDMHLRTDGNRGPVCAAGWPVFKASVLSQNVDYIFDGGDSINGNSQGDTFINQSALYNEVWGDVVIPKYTAIGNHDNLGNNKAQLRALFGMPDNYYYQDLGDKWRLIVLDSTFNGTGTQSPYLLGEVQTAWLTNLLAESADKHVVILSHVPILSVAAPKWYIYGGSNPVLAGTWNLTIDQHVDVYGLLELFRLNPCVKVCLSGHEHVYDDCITNANGETIRFINSGAVGINWWQDDDPGSFRNVYQKRGYGLLKFYDDGTVDNTIIYF